MFDDLSDWGLENNEEPTIYRIGEGADGMGPLTGLRPGDGRWGGELPEAIVEAIYNDVVNNDIESMVKLGAVDPDDMVSMVGSAIIQATMRTAQRIAVEFDGCRIDTSTIFDDMGEEQEVDPDLD